MNGSGIHDGLNYNPELCICQGVRDGARRMSANSAHPKARIKLMVRELKFEC